MDFFEIQLLIGETLYTTSSINGIIQQQKYYFSRKSPDLFSAEIKKKSNNENDLVTRSFFKLI